MREKLCIIIRDPESNSSNENPKECSIRKRSKKRTQSKTKSLFSKYRKALRRKDFYYKKKPDSHEKKSSEIKTEKSVEKI